MTQNKKKIQKILLATGGTGGHVFPAIALGDFLQKQGYEVAFSSDARGARYFEKYDFKLRKIQCASPSGNPLKKITALFKLGVGFLQSLFFVWRYDCIIGFGGYASFAPILAAKLFRKKVILHEQNAVLGKVNRVLQKFANHVALSFEKTKLVGSKANYVGSFVRDEFKFSSLPDVNAVLKVFITGGSQGAKIFSEVFPKAFTGLHVQVTHQVPEASLDDTKNEYEKLGIQADLRPFFHDMQKQISEAHIIISRSGASSILELTTIGRPTIFIPLKNSADNHQYENARELADQNAAWLLEEGENLAAEITGILQEIHSSPSMLVEKAEMMHNHANSQAKQEMLKLISGK